MSDQQPVPPASTPYTEGPAAPRSPVLSILSLVFGILGVLGALFLFGVGFLPAVAAVVLGFVGRRKEPGAKGLWLTGIILGFVGVVVAVIVWVVLGLVFAYAAQHGSVSG